MWGRMRTWQRGLWEPAVGLLVCWVMKRLLTGDIWWLLGWTPEVLWRRARGHSTITGEGRLPLWMYGYWLAHGMAGLLLRKLILGRMSSRYVCLRWEVL